jgi:Arc/MetJ family transcription regulator
VELPPHTAMCGMVCGMATNLDLDPALVDEAVAVGGRRTKKETVTEALREYIARRRQARIEQLFGTIEYDAAYDYKKQRRRR